MAVIVCLHEGGSIEFEATTDERIACQVLNTLAGKDGTALIM